MDTRWRSNLKLVGWALLLTLGLNSLLAGLSQSSHYVGRSYFESSEIQHELSRFIHYLAFFELGTVTEEEARRQIAVTQDEIEEHRHRYGDLQQQLDNIRMQYEPEIDMAKADGKADLTEELMRERDAKLADIRLNFRSDDHVRAKIRKEKEARLAQEYQRFEQYREQYAAADERFSYYLVDTRSGDVYTDMPMKPDRSNEAELLRNMYKVMKYTGGEGNLLTIRGIPSMFPHNEEVERAAAANPAKHYEGWIAIPKTAAFKASYERYERYRWVAYLTAIAGALMLAAAVMYGRRSLAAGLQSSERGVSLYRRIPIDLRLLLTIVACLIAASLLDEPLFRIHLESMRANPVDWGLRFAWKLFIWTAFLTAAVVQVYYWLKLLQERTSLREEWKRSLTARLSVALLDLFRNRRNGTKAALLFAAAGMFGVGAIVVSMEDDFIVVYLLAYAVVGLVLGGYVIRQIGYLNKIMAAAEAVAAGRPVDDLPVRRKSALGRLADHLNRMKRGVVVSQAKEAKSERLKTELITNVSHDLRTPLTAVISYVELLKKPDLTDEERTSYIGVIDQRSKRLKVLIDDLFEASKMASGSAELNRSRVDLVQLMKQALAESEEKMASADLQFRIKLPDTPAYAIIDGQKIWRVFDNLIGNILRYSLERSRVYITLTCTDGRAEIAFKNVAKYELGDNVDELFERFKRGDTSRHTDGSGLGLAIAKSIVDLHGGTLALDVDGDLFKATVTLPLE